MPVETVQALAAGGLSAEIVCGASSLLPRFGPRFDRSAYIRVVTLHGHTFLHPAGCCDEFGLRGEGVLGFAEAPPGGEFLKLGVGTLRRLEAPEYSFATAYPLVHDAEFHHETAGPAVHATASGRLDSGWGYRLGKRIALAPPDGLEIAYRLENTGTNAFSFEHYNHHWFRFDGAESGPDYELHSPLLPAPESLPPGWTIAGSGLRLRAGAPASGGIAVRWPVPPHARAAHFRLAHRPSGLAVTITPDFTPARLAVWSVREAFCPELFLQCGLPAGAHRTWSVQYRFRAEA